MTEIYIDKGLNKFAHMFKKRYATFVDAVNGSYTGDTIYLPHNLQLTAGAVITNKNLLIVGDGSWVNVPTGSAFAELHGNSQVILRNVKLRLPHQANGLNTGTDFTGSVTLENCQLQHDDHHFITNMEYFASLTVNGGSLTLLNSTVDNLVVKAQSVAISNSHIGSINSRGSMVAASKLQLNNSTVNHIQCAVLNVAAPTTLLNDTFGLGVTLLGNLVVKSSRCAYDAADDARFSRRLLAKMLVEYGMSDQVAVISTRDFNNAGSSITLNNLQFDDASYHDGFTTARQGNYCWFDLAGQATTLQQLNIPALLPSATNIAGGSVSLVSTTDKSAWVPQDNLHVAARDSHGGLVDHANTGGSQAAAQGEAPQQRSALDELQAMIGLAPVKKAITQQIAVATVNAMKAKQGLAVKATNMNMVFAGHAGTGKAITKDTLVPTPNGWRFAGSIKPRDWLFGADGQPVQVLGVFDQGDKHVMCVNFADGRQVRCNDEHIWHVVATRDGSVHDLTTQQLLAAHQPYAVINNAAVTYPTRSLPVDPYLFGLCVSAASIAPHVAAVNFSLGNHPTVIAAVCRQLSQLLHTRVHSYRAAEQHNTVVQFKADKPFRQTNYTTRQQTAYCRITKRYLITLPDIIHDQQLRMYARQRHIPFSYQCSSTQQRWQLLQGIFDGHGYVTDDGQVTLATPSAQLAQDVANVLRSLGLAARVARVQHHFVVTVYGTCAQLHRLFKHRSLVGLTPLVDNAQTTTLIDSITTTRQQAPMVCFYVNSADHLFLCNDYVVTHNTTVAKLFARAVYEKGILPKNNFVATLASSLIGNHVGDTEANVTNAMRQAKGSVLLIDEAYQWAPRGDNGNVFGKNAIDTLVGNLTTDEFKNQIAVILAGYTGDMQHMFKVGNVGLSRRFPNWITFPDYSDVEMVQILMFHLQRKDLHFANKQAQQHAVTALLTLKKQANADSSNGGLVEILVDKLVNAQATRLMSTNATDRETLSTITDVDVTNAYQDAYATMSANMFANPTPADKP